MQKEICILKYTSATALQVAIVQQYSNHAFCIRNIVLSSCEINWWDIFCVFIMISWNKTKVIIKVPNN